METHIHSGLDTGTGNLLQIMIYVVTIIREQDHFDLFEDLCTPAERMYLYSTAFEVHHHFVKQQMHIKSIRHIFKNSCVGPRMDTQRQKLIAFPLYKCI